MFPRSTLRKSGTLFPAAGAIAILSASIGIAAAPQTARADLSGFGPEVSVTRSSPTTPDGNYYEDNGTMTFNAEDTAAGQGFPMISDDGWLNLTDTGPDEAASAWYDTKQDISKPWTASFVWQSSGGADGFYFGVQNTDAGLNYLGAGGGARAFTTDGGSPPAKGLGVGVEAFGGSKGLHLTYDNLHFLVQPSTSVIDLGSYAVVTPFNVTVTYDGDARLSFAISRGSNAFNYNWILNDPLSTIVGDDKAYVGITAATGGLSDYQAFDNFNFVEQSSAAATAPVPEPTTLGLLAIGAGGLLLGRRRRKPAA